MPSLFTASTVDRDPCGFAGSMALANESEIESNRGTICRQPSLCRRRIDQRERSFLTGSFGWVVLLTVIYLQRSEKKAGQSCAVRRSNKSFDTLSLSMYKRERGNNCDKQDPAGKIACTSQWALEFLVGIDDDFVRVKMFICTRKG